MRRSRNRDDRDKYADAAKAMRWAMSRFDEAQRAKEVRWTPADWQVLHAVLRHIGTYSRVWDAMSVKELSRLSGLHERTCTKSMKKLDEHDVISWDRGDGRDWSEVYLPTSEGRPHSTAPRSEKQGGPRDTTSESAAPGAATFDRPRGGHMSPPEPRRHFAREDTSTEKQAASQPTCVPSVEEPSPTEEPGAAREVSSDGTPDNPVSNRRAGEALVDLVADVLGDVEPERKRKVERVGSIWTDPSGNPIDPNEEA